MNGTSINLILLVVFTLLYSFLLFYLNWSNPWTPWQGLLSVARSLPVLCLSLSIALIIVSAKTQHNGVDGCQAELQMDNDIGGIGVLLGLFLPACVLVLILLLGHFEATTFGAKELCVAQTANLIYLALNIAKSFKTLHYAELLVACSSIDAVSGSISMAFSYKDIFAARKVILLGFIIQLFAFAVLGPALYQVQHYPDAACAAQIRHPVFDHNHPTLMWVYYAVRILLVVAPAPIAYKFSVRLNKMERGLRLGPHVKEARTWASLPATLFMNYLYFLGIFLLHGTAVVFFIPRAASKKESWKALWSQWGQSAALIVAICAIIHVFYSLAKLYRDHRREKKNGDAQGVPDASYSPPKLRSPDELLFDDEPLETYEEMKTNMTDQEKNDVWKELASAFKIKDISWINDCLDRGSPLDWKDNRGEFPLHLAARLGDTDILGQIYRLRPLISLMDTDPSKEIPILLAKNTSGETPMQVAVNANASAAIGFLRGELVQLRQTAYQWQNDIDNVVISCFKAAIEHEKVAALEQLTLWPSWQNLDTGDWPAVDFFTRNLWNVGYEKDPYSVELKPSGPKEKHENRDKCLRILIERSAMSHSKRRDFVKAHMRAVKSAELGKFMLKQMSRSGLSDDTIIYKITDRDVIKHALRLGLAQTLDHEGADRSIVFVVAAYEGHNQVVRDLSKSALPDDIVDCAFMTLHLDDGTKRVLLNKGAHDWSEFLTAANDKNLEKLKQLISNEGVTERIRMMKARDENGQSVLSVLLRSISGHYVQYIPACLDLLLQKGADASVVDFQDNTTLHIALRNMDPPIEIIKSLLSRLGPMDVNRRNKNGDTAFHEAAQGTFINRQYGVDLFETLLRTGMDPKLTNREGFTVFQLVEREIKKPKKAGYGQPVGAAERKVMEEYNQKVLDLLKPYR